MPRVPTIIAAVLLFGCAVLALLNTIGPLWTGMVAAAAIAAGLAVWWLLRHRRSSLTGRRARLGGGGGMFGGRGRAGGARSGLGRLFPGLSRRSVAGRGGLGTGTTGRRGGLLSRLGIGRGSTRPGGRLGGTTAGTAPRRRGLAALFGGSSRRPSPTASGGRGRAGGRSWRPSWLGGGSTSRRGGTASGSTGRGGKKNSGKSAVKRFWDWWNSPEMSQPTPPKPAAPSGPADTVRREPAPATSPAASTTDDDVPAPAQVRATPIRVMTTGGAMTHPLIDPAEQARAAASAYHPQSLHKWATDLKHLPDVIRNWADSIGYIAQNGEDDLPAHQAVIDHLNSIADTLRAAATSAEDLPTKYLANHQQDQERVDAPRKGSHAVEAKADVRAYQQEN